MAVYVARRVLYLIPVLLGIALVTFVVLKLTGDPATIILGQHATADRVAALRQKLGLDDPVPVQLARFLWGAARGDLGRSWFTERPVLDEMLYRFPHTVELTIASMVIATVVGVLVGVVSAVRQYSWFDHLSMVGALMGVSMPIFWLGLILIEVFSIKLGWLPVDGRIDLTLGFAPPTNFLLFEALRMGNWPALKSVIAHLVLPSLALGALSMGLIARMTRSSLLEVIRQDYIRTARAKGLSERVVIFKHALRNALIPVTTVVGLQVGSLLGGAVLTETVFSLPGVGSLAVDSIMRGDYPMVQGTVLLVATVFVFVNLVVDLVYAYLDPRIRLG